MTDDIRPSIDRYKPCIRRLIRVLCILVVVISWFGRHSSWLLLSGCKLVRQTFQSGSADTKAAEWARHLPSNLTHAGNDFRFLGITDKGVTELARHLPSELTHLHLDFHSTSIGDKGAMELARHLPSELTDLYLGFGETNIGDKGAMELARHLPQTITQLSLSFLGTNIGDRGAMELARHLPNKITHLSLIFVCTNIGDKGAMELARHLPSELTGLYLFFGETNIGDKGAMELARHLPSELTDSNLGFQGTNIGDKGAMELARHLPSELTYLRLELDIGDRGAMELARHLPSTLERFEVYVDGFTSLRLFPYSMGTFALCTIVGFVYSVKRFLIDIQLFQPKLWPARTWVNVFCVACFNQTVLMLILSRTKAGEHPSLKLILLGSMYDALVLTVMPVLYGSYWFFVGLLWRGQDAQWMFNSFTNSSFMALAASWQFLLNLIYWCYSPVALTILELPLLPLLLVNIGLDWCAGMAWMAYFCEQHTPALRTIHQRDLQPGDHVYRRGAFGLKGLTHHAIYVGHMGGADTSEDEHAVIEVNGNKIEQTPWSKFLLGPSDPFQSGSNLTSGTNYVGLLPIVARRYRSERMPSPRDVANRAVRRMQESDSNPWSYWIFNRNCEFFATELIFGDGHTSQGRMASLFCWTLSGGALDLWCGHMLQIVMIQAVSLFLLGEVPFSPSIAGIILPIVFGGLLGWSSGILFGVLFEDDNSSSHEFEDFEVLSD